MEDLMELRSLHDVFTHELKDMHSAEKQILQALPDMVGAADSPDLREALEEHQRVTERQVERLEQIFESLEETPPSGKKCKGMEGILKEGEELLEEDPDGNGALDAAIIGAAQKVEHYEIAAYGTLVAFARKLGNEEAAQLLEETLQEEKDADERLTEIAAKVNDEADTGASGEEEDEGTMTTGRSRSKGPATGAEDRPKRKQR
jgi:ferritin-like metal-binding protein YciE